MTEAIRIICVSPPGASHWRARKADGTYLCDIHLHLSDRVYGSSYYVLKGGSLVKQGTFTYVVWDAHAVLMVLTAILRAMSPGAEVTVKPAPRGRRPVRLS